MSTLKKCSEHRFPHSRRGCRNYNQYDVKHLLGLVGNRKTIENDHWVRISAEFNEWAWNNKRPSRTVSSLKNKFARLGHGKKLSSDSVHSRQARRAREIWLKIHRKKLDMKNGDKQKNTVPDTSVSQTAEETPPLIGKRRKRQVSTDFGVPCAKRQEVNCAKHLENIAKCMASVARTLESYLSEEREETIREIVREEVNYALSLLLNSRENREALGSTLSGRSSSEETL